MENNVLCTKIYLVTNCYGDPNKVYIGKTKNSRKNNHKKTYGEYIEYSYIDQVDSLNRKDWGLLETYWIEQFRQWGFKVVNHNKKGGSGPEFQKEESKVKISQNIIRGKKISEKNKGKKQSKEHIEKRRLIVTGRKDSDEGRKNKSLAALGKTKFKPEGFGEKISQKLKGHIRYQNPTRNKLISIKNKKRVEQFDRQGNFIKEWESQYQASFSLNNKYTSMISECCKGKRKTAYGFIWKYKK
jgi:hypothetical protein